MLDAGRSAGVARLIRHTLEFWETMEMNAPRSGSEPQRMLMRLLEFRSPSRVCELCGIDEDTLDGLLDDAIPWPPGVFDTVREALARYADYDMPSITDQAAEPCDATLGDGSLESDAAVSEGVPATPSAEVRRPAPIVDDRQSGLQRFTALIDQRCGEANEILDRDDASGHQDLWKLRTQLAGLSQMTLDASTVSESEDAALVWARLAADRVIWKIDAELPVWERRSGGWWQGIKNWMRN